VSAAGAGARAALEARGVSMAFGGLKAVTDVSFSVAEGVIFSIIGPNGAGKTTLFNVLTGLHPRHLGRVLLDGAEITRLRPHERAAHGLARTFQNLQIFARLSVLDNVRVGRHRKDRPGVLRAIFRPPGTAAAERASRAAAHAQLDRVGLADVAHRPAGGLAYGMMKRLEIARALASEPRVLLLDEPAAGCNPAETEGLLQLFGTIARDGVTLLLVEHDMKLVMGVSDRVLVLVQGRVLVEGTPAAVKNDPQVIASYLGTSEVAAPVAVATKGVMAGAPC